MKKEWKRCFLCYLMKRSSSKWYLHLHELIFCCYSNPNVVRRCISFYFLIMSLLFLFCASITIDTAGFHTFFSRSLNFIFIFFSSSSSPSSFILFICFVQNKSFSVHFSPSTSHDEWMHAVQRAHNIFRVKNLPFFCEKKNLLFTIFDSIDVTSCIIIIFVM